MSPHLCFAGGLTADQKYKILIDALARLHIESLGQYVNTVNKENGPADWITVDEAWEGELECSEFPWDDDVIARVTKLLEVPDSEIPF